MPNRTQEVVVSGPVSATQAPMPVQLVHTTSDSSVWAILARWLTGQEAMVVLLFAILGMVGFGGYYSIQTAIPAHLQSIQGGYDRLTATHKEEMVNVAAATKEATKAQADVFEKMLTKQADTHEKTMIRIADTFDKTVEKALKSNP